MAGIRYVQINLHHCKAAMALLGRQLKGHHFDIALMQDPYINPKGLVSGLGKYGVVTYGSKECTRTCVYVRNGINAMPLYDLCSRDLTAVKVFMGKSTVVFASVYLAYPTDERRSSFRAMEELVEFCNREKLQLVMGCDANAHHTVWGSSDTNGRGEELYEYLVSSSLQLLNTGNNPTFVDAKRSEVIDITMATNGIYKRITNWRVLDDISGSDHRYISFRYNTEELIPSVRRRNPRYTNWDNFYKELKIELGTAKGKLNCTVDIELEAERIDEAIKIAWHTNCPEKEKKGAKTPWWTSDLEKQRQKTRKLFNEAKKKKCFKEYSKALTEYNLAVRKSKRKSWQSHCQEINCIPEGVRLAKAMSVTKTHELGAVRNHEGRQTGKETLKIMTETHFPDCIMSDQCGKSDKISIEEQDLRTTKSDWDVAKKVVDEKKLNWVIKSFQPYKSPGPDGIYPILLQQGYKVLEPHLMRLFKACIAFGYTPKIWREVKVTYIPKPGKPSYEEAKSYRPISLSSFLLKTLEKLVDIHIRDGPLKKKPLHNLQCAYQSGKSTETALHHIITKAEKAIDQQEICVAAFLDIEGAFDRTTFGSIMKAANDHGISKTICRWIHIMLKGRRIWSSLLGDDIYAVTTKGCPQGGVLSPTLWCLVVDSLLNKLNRGPYFTVGYADDIVIMISGKFPEIVSQLLQQALNEVEEWCTENHLTINPHKTTVLPFTRKRKLDKLMKLRLFDTELKWSIEVKYLGLTLDKELTWKLHSERAIAKAIRAFNMCRSTYGKTWGLKPRVIYFIYTTMVRPILSYGSAVWWPRTQRQDCIRELGKLQRMVTMAITGAFKTTPTKALDIILNLNPLHIFIKQEAIKAIQRLKVAGTISDKMPVTRHTKLELHNELLRKMNMTSDEMPPLKVFRRYFKVHVPTREDWKQELSSKNANKLVWYTDGSKTATGTGAGIYSDTLKIWESLGKYATVFQAEMYAIIACAEINLQRNVKNKTIYILSDSQASLKALESCKVNSKLVLNALQLLNKLGRDNKINLIWVPGHSGIQGNEEADELARMGSAGPMCGPEPFLGLPACSIKRAIKEYSDVQHKKEWYSSAGLLHSKKFIDSSTRLFKFILNNNRDKVRGLVGAFTGHYETNDMLYKLKKTSNSDCRACGEVRETMEHLLCECDVLATKRMSVLGTAYPEPQEYSSLPLGGIAALVNHIFET